MQFTKLTTIEEVQALVDYHNAKSKHVTIDTETTGLSYVTDNISLVILSGRVPNSASCFSPTISEPLRRLVSPTLVFQNFKFDLRMFLKCGIDFSACRIRDTLLLHHLYDESLDHDLDSIVQSRYGDDYKSVFWAKYTSFDQATEQDKLEYACKDVIYTDLLYRELLKDLEEQGIPESLIEHQHQLAMALFKTEVQGIPVDLDYLSQIAVELKPTLLSYPAKMKATAPIACDAVELDLWAKQIDKAWTPKGNKWKNIPKPILNFNSHSQVNSLLYDKLRLPEQVKWDKKKKAFSRTTEYDALEKIQFLHPVVPMLMEYAEYHKVYGSFIEGTLERLQDGRIYPSFNINGTVTGRISSSDPNLQQLPAKGEWAKVRGIYIPDDGCSILTCDYSQLEVVIAAHFSQDPNLLKIVFEGVSKHDITAAALKIERGLAKTLNFAMQYQCSPFKVAKLMGCSDKEAVYIWNKYWETYALEKRVIDECKAKVDSGRPIVNPFGRHRHFTGTYRNKWEREAAYRQAYSSLIQGTGADCCHYAFYTVAGQLEERQWGRALFEVHDEIVINAKKEYCGQASEMLQYNMIQAGKIANLSVPLSVDCSEPLARWKK